MPNQSWDGRIERRGNPNDHDTLTRTLVSVENLVKNFDKHVADDEKAIKSIRDQVGKHAIYIYMGLGAIGVIQFLIKGH